MYHTNQFDDYVISSSSSSRQFLERLDRQKLRTLIVINRAGKLVGIASMGDWNRFVLSKDNLSLGVTVEEFMNSNPVFVRHRQLGDMNVSINLKFNLVPVIDDNHLMVGALVRPRTQDVFAIDGQPIGLDHPPYVIAEIGNNHNGSLEIAKELVRKASEAGVNAVKFQLRDLEVLYGASAKGGANLGDEYIRELVQNNQLSRDNLRVVLRYAEDLGLTAFCTPWDLSSLNFLVESGVPVIKIASADLTNPQLLRAAALTGIPLICSTGMSYDWEIEGAVKLLESCHAKFALLHCNSTYPAPYEDINLRFIERLRDLSRGRPVGYSGHERGWAVVCAAIASGASVIEKHFTLDRNQEGVDHKVSLLPDELATMVRSINDVWKSLGSGGSRHLSQGELLNRSNLAKSIFACKSLRKGQTLTQDDIEIRSPGNGLQPNRLSELLKIPVSRDMAKGDIFYDIDLRPAAMPFGVVAASPPPLKSLWGIPVRHRDAIDLNLMFNPRVLEFHLSYKDLYLSDDEFLTEFVDKQLVIHCPELFKGDHLLNLCSTDEAYRSDSIDWVKQTFRKGLSIKKFLPDHQGDVGVVINVGGYSADGFLSQECVEERTEILIDSLNQLNEPGIQVWPQTMPPYPWHFGGQCFHNLFVHPKWIVEFLKKYPMKICLDISHTALACNLFSLNFLDVMRELLPHTAHLHLSDAEGVRGEGLQIGSGDIEYERLANLLNTQYSGSWIPEIWQGHENNGNGFSIALHNLYEAGLR